MTESKALDNIISMKAEMGYELNDTKQMKRIKRDSLNIAIKALKEIHQYRVIGTVEECQDARQRLKMKKPVKDEYNRDCCPNCGWIVYYDEYGGRYLHHCENCGQAIDWSENNN